MDALDAAAAVARWLRTRAADTGGGRCWPSAGIREGGPRDRTLAWGPAGVVLFLLRAHETLGDDALLDDAVAGAETLLSAIACSTDHGLYNGMAGVAYVLAETFAATGDDRYRAAAARAAGRLDVDDPRTDLYEGVAGTGLVLLHLARALGDDDLTARAAAAAEQVAARALPAGDGLRWPGSPGRPELPNFAHGTAGIAFFLAVAARATGRPALLDAAVAGGTYLRSIARTADGGCAVPLAEVARDVYWHNWCQGSVGTSRLWQVLADATGDAVWRDCLDGAARGVLSQLHGADEIGDTANETSLCCGSAGLLDLLTDRRLATGEDLSGAGAHVLRHLARHATAEGDRLHWRQGGRVRTGWHAGAAGTGYALLRWGALEHGLAVPAALPDSPWARQAAVTS